MSRMIKSFLITLEVQCLLQIAFLKSGGGGKNGWLIGSKALNSPPKNYTKMNLYRKVTCSVIFSHLICRYAIYHFVIFLRIEVEADVPTYICRRSS
jgi:hypothetical protein